ncbi:expansin-A26-like [Miscanthus floridulus]|uniref:expansin-A26-like n=1 Tax=Miscanthus floridulus TaxID=154761 RepID=UPI003458B2F9
MSGRHHSWTIWAPLLASLLLVELALSSAVGAKVVEEEEDDGGASKKKPHINHGKFKVDPWTDGHATFYGGRDGSGTTDGGACGYKGELGKDYSALTVAVGPSLYSNGAGCGVCYELKGTVVVMATNQAPPPVSGQKGEHFELTMLAFLKITEEKDGIMPITYRKVVCVRQGGIQYTITGNPHYNMVMVTNVGGAGDVVGLSVKGNKRVKWTPMKCCWGQLWTTEVDLTGESLTFHVKTGDHRNFNTHSVGLVVGRIGGGDGGLVVRQVVHDVEVATTLGVAPM